VRILHAPFNTGGHPVELAMAERDLGFTSESVQLGRHAFGYRADKTFGKSLFAIELYRYYLLIYAIKKFDIIHFNSGISFFPKKFYPPRTDRYTLRQRIYNVYAHMLQMQDVKILRWFGKGIVVTFQGDDIRSLNPFSDSQLAQSTPTYSDRKNRNNLKISAKWAVLAHQIYYLNPDLKEYIGGKSDFMAYASVDPKKILLPQTNNLANKPFTFLHAPSDRATKGTKYIIDVFKELSQQNVNVELIIMEQVSHQEILSALKECDAVIDQLLVGWYGGFAVEAMANKKPVIAWIDPGQLANTPTGFSSELPIISASRDELGSKVLELINLSPSKRQELGEKSRKFSEDWHSPTSIAKITTTRYIEILTREIFLDRNIKTLEPPTE
jgi:glycosyltransferase involved in cell wall biosynthesis